MSNVDKNRAQHPGAHLRQMLSERGMLQSDLAFILGQSVHGISLITVEKRGISAEMSKALGKALDLEPDYFANLQKEYDLDCATDPDPDISLRNSMVKAFPVRDMIRRGWLQDGDAGYLQSQLATFFRVENPDEIPYLSHAAKKTDYDSDAVEPAQLAWLFRVRQIAEASIVSPYSKRALNEAVGKLRNLLTAPEEARHVPRLLAECGVRLVAVEPLPKARIDGVCLWLNQNSPVLGMSFRYDRIDNFWFVLRHEIEHILREDGMENPILDSELEGENAGVGDALPEEERAANTAAASFLVPPEKIESFIRRKKPFFYEKDVLAFAKLQNVHPGIVVGQMQHRLNRYNYLNKHQVKIRQNVIPGAMADGWGQTIPV
jgi:HTH-type transcriptional regulator / antitoxin HigA